MNFEQRTKIESIWDCLSQRRDPNLWLTYNQIQNIQNNDRKFLLKSEFFETSGQQNNYELYKKYLVVRSYIDNAGL